MKDKDKVVEEIKIRLKMNAHVNQVLKRINLFEETIPKTSVSQTN